MAEKKYKVTIQVEYEIEIITNEDEEGKIKEAALEEFIALRNPDCTGIDVSDIEEIKG